MEEIEKENMPNFEMKHANFEKNESSLPKLKLFNKNEML